MNSAFVGYEEFCRSRRCYPPRPSASVDNTFLDLQNSSYLTQPHSIIARYTSHHCLQCVSCVCLGLSSGHSEVHNGNFINASKNVLHIKKNIVLFSLHLCICWGIAFLPSEIELNLLFRSKINFIPIHLKTLPL